ncbi:MAG: phosphatase PAP2 family protein [Gordonia amarae]
MSIDESEAPAPPQGVEPLLTDLGKAAELDPDMATRRDLTWVRRAAIALWALGMFAEFWVHGLAFDRTRLILLMCFGMFAACIGRRRAITVVIDWLPFVLILLFYDWTRNVAQLIDMPTQWHLAPDVDKWMFGVNPTVWLQSHLKYAEPTWWEVVTSVVYISYFIVPYAMAAILWVRDRTVWRRYAACFLATTFIALVGYTLVPAAPPWAAAQCTAEQVKDHPRDPPCMHAAQPEPDGGLLGQVEPRHDGAAPYVERISWRGWSVLKIHNASQLFTMAQGKSNLVAAIPSLHAGLTMLLALFMWPRVKALGKTLFMAYPFAMAFALVFTAEHYVIDILLGWALAASVIAVCRWVDRRWLIPRQQRVHAEQDDAAAIEVTNQKQELNI